MIARTAALTILVKDFAAARASLDSIVAKHNGYSASLTSTLPKRGNETSTPLFAFPPIN